MKSLYILRNGKESAISVTMIEELKAEHQAALFDNSYVGPNHEQTVVKP